MTANFNIATPIHYKRPNEVRNVAVDMSGKLEQSALGVLTELCTGTVTVTEYTVVLDSDGVPSSFTSSSSLTFANKAVSTAALIINDVSVAIGGACQFKVSGGTAAVIYGIVVSVATNSSPAQTIEEVLLLSVSNT